MVREILRADQIVETLCPGRCNKWNAGQLISIETYLKTHLVGTSCSGLAVVACRSV
jgi:hypothetical protein